MKVCLQKASAKIIVKGHSILYMPFCVYSITSISWSTLQCLKTTSTVLLENNGENWKCQVFRRSVLSGKIKLWFKHQPKLDSFRHMVFTTAPMGKHVLKVNQTHPPVHIDSCAAYSRFPQHTPCFRQSTCLMSSTPPCT